jgi:hypothetical protein
MAATREPAEVAPGTVSFELEQFERTDGRLELRGRWYGVRGVRFVRPTLRLRSATGSSRALADLEHKPWIPDDGEPWAAAFPCDEDVEVLDAELAVTSGIVIPLPAPGADHGDAGPIAVLPQRERTRAKSGNGSGETAAAPRPPAGSAPPTTREASPKARKARRREPHGMPGELAALREETERLRAEPVRLQGELDESEQLRKHVEGELQRLKLDSDGAMARRDAAVGRFEDAAAERDAAVEARDAAVTERDQAHAKLQATAAERDRLAAERDRVLAERDAAIAGREQATAERDRAIAERDRAIAERDRARAQRAPSLSRRAAPAPARGLPAPLTLSDEQTRTMHRAIAIAVLFAAGIALLIVLGVL